MNLQSRQRVEADSQRDPVGTAVHTERALELIGRFRKDLRLYCLDFADRWVLFRIDGMIVRLSRPAFELLSAPDAIVSDVMARICAEHGTSSVASLVDELEELAKDGFLSSDVPDFIPVHDVKNRRSLAGILIMVTQTCNLACVYCYAGGGSYGQPTKMQKTDNALLAIDQLIEKSGRRSDLQITLFGGEPLLNVPLIHRIVQYAEEQGALHRKRFSYSITTNGTLVTEEIARFFRKHRFSVLVSFDGVEWYHDKHRPTTKGAPSFQAVQRGIKTLVEAGIPD